MNWILLANSLVVAGAAALLALAWGAAGALCLASAPRGLRAVLLSLTIAVLALPAFLMTNCWIDLLGPAGALRRFLPLNIFSLAGTVLILSLMFWPIPALAIHSAWQKLEPVHFEIDPALRRFSLLKTLLWPSARSMALMSAAVVFALALNNFSVPALLQVKVFPAEAWVQFNTNLDPVAALRLSWPLIVVPAALLLCFRRFEYVWPRESGTDFAPVLRRQLGPAFLTGVSLVSILVVTLALLVPLAELVAAPRTWREFIPAVRAGMPALANSLLYAVPASLLAVVFGLLLARVRVLGWLWLLFLLPGILLGIGALTAFNRPGLEFFSRTAAIVIALLVLRYVALARAMSRAAWRSLDTALLDSARLDGARGWTLFRRILLPQLAPPAAAAAYIIYVLCLWDVETILLVIPPAGETLALRIFNLLHYGHNAHVNALCLLLLLLALAPLLLLVPWRLVATRKIFSRSLRAGRAVALIAFVTLLGGCKPQRHATENHITPLASSIFSQVQVIGTRGTGAGEFNKPRSLTVDAHDNLFVVDLTGRVQKFSPDGTFLLSWQMPQTDLGKPKGMCRDREGNIVVLEPHYQRVNHFTPDGKLVAQWGVHGTNAGELTLPRAIAVDTKNNVIVTEYTLVDRAQKFTARGERWLAAWGTPGLAPGQFNRAEGVCVDARDVIYIADSCTHRIQIFSSEGKFLRTYGRAGAAPGEMSYPYDIAVDEQGRQYVCEFGNSRIQVFDRDDRPLEIIGRAGGEPGEFANPWSIALDSQGNLYVADSQNHRVQKLLRKTKAKLQTREDKHQTPNTKHQITSNLQSPRDRALGLGRLDPDGVGWSLGFGVCLVFGVWCLVFLPSPA
jgi:ABC-type Fe3+ transport system permease subunit/DNA-binding beta-propeller fold protein YncE